MKKWLGWAWRRISDLSTAMWLVTLGSAAVATMVAAIVSTIVDLGQPALGFFLVGLTGLITVLLVAGARLLEPVIAPHLPRAPEKQAVDSPGDALPTGNQIFSGAYIEALRGSLSQGQAMRLDPELVQRGSSVFAYKHQPYLDWRQNVFVQFTAHSHPERAGRFAQPVRQSGTVEEEMDRDLEALRAEIHQTTKAKANAAATSWG